MRISLRVALALALLPGLVLFYKSIPHTPGTGTDQGVATLEHVTLGGYEQAVLIRGQDRKSPLLLFLHGGPGMPAMYLAHAFQRPLEEDFTVVHWDQRGAGKSYRDELDPETLRVSRLLDDAKALLDTLRIRYGQDRVYLVGHSWGSYLGTLLVLRHPDRFHAYVGVGQVVGSAEEEHALQARFIRREALARGDTAALADLDGVGPAAHETWLFRFGGELAGATSWMPLLLTGLRAPEYSLRDIFRIAPGSSLSSRVMVRDVVDGPLEDHVTAYPVPTFFFTGRRDWTTPHPLIERYYRRIEAPYKELVWFGESAHFPFFEEPTRFAAEMRRVRAVVESGG